ncbi:MAG: hypothetical protein LBI62_01580 [Candidatus Accumulibacter sp.]|nr:hypothetical protein [Accumulibacter sp.]
MSKYRAIFRKRRKKYNYIISKEILFSTIHDRHPVVATNRNPHFSVCEIPHTRTSSDQVSGIRDQGSGIRDQGSGIRDQ